MLHPAILSVGAGTLLWLASRKGCRNLFVPPTTRGCSTRPFGVLGGVRPPYALIDLVMSEVQSGDYLGEDDIVRVQDTYGRCSNDSSENGAEEQS